MSEIYFEILWTILVQTTVSFVNLQYRLLQTHTKPNSSVMTCCSMHNEYNKTPTLYFIVSVSVLAAITRRACNTEL